MMHRSHTEVTLESSSDLRSISFRRHGLKRVSELDALHATNGRFSVSRNKLHPLHDNLHLDNLHLPPPTFFGLQVSTLKLFPSRVVSRLYGAVNTLPLPLHARPVVFGAWAWFFHVNLDEVQKPLIEYPHMTAFFTRQLRLGVRPIDLEAPLVSPVDGRVVSVSSDLSKLGVLSQIKGLEYHLTDFLGIQTPALSPGNALFSATLYLAPGDYHRFHSPTEWVCHSRTHFAGQLLPVNPLVSRLIPSLFCANERVALFGRWRHGFFSYTAVGATNVGSIRIAFDDEVVTNTWQHDWHCGFKPLEAVGLSKSQRSGSMMSHSVVRSREYDPPVPLTRGEDVGHFELGSTVVLVFEAPVDFNWSLVPGARVAVGASIASLPSSSAAAAGAAGAGVLPRGCAGGAVGPAAAGVAAVGAPSVPSIRRSAVPLPTRALGSGRARSASLPIIAPFSSLMFGSSSQRVSSVATSATVAAAFVSSSDGASCCSSVTVASSSTTKSCAITATSTLTLDEDGGAVSARARVERDDVWYDVSPESHPHGSGDDDDFQSCVSDDSSGDSMVEERRDSWQFYVDSDDHSDRVDFVSSASYSSAVATTHDDTLGDAHQRSNKPHAAVVVVPDLDPVFSHRAPRSKAGLALQALAFGLRV